MLITVQFDDELCGGTEKIDNIGADGMLAAETPTRLAIPQQRPELALRLSAMGTQVPGNTTLEFQTASGMSARN